VDCTGGIPAAAATELLLMPDRDVLLRNCDERSGHRQGQTDLLPMTLRTASRRIPCSVAIVPEADLEHVGGAAISSFSFGSPAYFRARRRGSHRAHQLNWDGSMGRFWASAGVGRRYAAG
jgi:hypothetical protein